MDRLASFEACEGAPIDSHLLHLFRNGVNKFQVNNDIALTPPGAPRKLYRGCERAGGAKSLAATHAQPADSHATKPHAYLSDHLRNLQGDLSEIMGTENTARDSDLASLHV